MRRRTEQKINRILSKSFAVILIPMALLVLIQRMKIDYLAKQVNMEYTTLRQSTEIVGVTEHNYDKSFQEETVGEEVFVEGAIQEKNVETETLFSDNEKAAMEELLFGMVAKEISLDYADEAIKAQTVLARTNLYAAKKNQTELPEAFATKELQELWGVQYVDYQSRLQKLIQSTNGEVLTYQGDYIYAAFHAVSGGTTRNMSELYSDSSMPYLTSVACHDDMSADGYIAVYYWEKQEFLDLCKERFDQVELLDCSEVTIQKRDSSDYVLEVLVGQTTYTGEDFREKLGLNSANFSIKILDGNIRIVTKGLGHGFGLSQNTAGQMALQGKNYEEILQFFFPEAEIAE